jgi:DNA polymerase I-like protein with 3'-5' exonuclease and polymerase domains
MVDFAKKNTQRRLEKLFGSSGKDWQWERTIAIDTETTGTRVYHGHRPFAVSLCDWKGKRWWFRWDVDPVTRKVRVLSSDVAKIKKIIAKYSYYVFHNAPFDIPMLEAIGISIPWDRAHDTLTMAHVYNSVEPHGLKPLAYKYLDISQNDQTVLEETVKQAIAEARKYHPDWDLGPVAEWNYWLPHAFGWKDVSKEYGVLDAVRTILLYKMYLNALEHGGLWSVYLRERSVLPVTHRMQKNGMPLRPKVLKERITEIQAVTSECSAKLCKMAARFKMYDEKKEVAINPNSSQQVADFLYYHLGLPNHGSTAKEVVEDMLFDRTLTKQQRTALETLQKYRAHNASETYLKSYRDLCVLGRLHFKFNQHGTKATRYSSSEPNGQNISKWSEVGVRMCFGPGKGRVWYCIDFSQLELRCLAVIAKEERMLEVFRHGGDIHQETGDVLGIPRQLGKTVNFAWVYGAGSQRLAWITGLEVSTFIERMRTGYPRVVAYMKENMALCRKLGYAKTLGGYRIPTASDQAYKGTNYVVQGTAGDIAKIALYLCQEYIDREGLDILIIGIIHDEIIFDAAKGVHKKHIVRLKELMEQAGTTLGVVTPVDCKIAKTNWHEVEDFSLAS